MSTLTSVLFLVYVLLACLNSRRAASHSLVNRELLYFRSCLRLLPGFKVVVVPNIVCVVLYNTSENCYMPVFKSTSLFVILSIRFCKTVILVCILFVNCSVLFSSHTILSMSISSSVSSTFGHVKHKVTLIGKCDEKKNMYFECTYRTERNRYLF